MKSTVALWNNLPGSASMALTAQHPAEMYKPALCSGFVLLIKVGWEGDCHDLHVALHFHLWAYNASTANTASSLSFLVLNQMFLCGLRLCERQGTSENIWHKCQLDIGHSVSHTRALSWEAGWLHWQLIRSRDTERLQHSLTAAATFPIMLAGMRGRAPFTHPAPPRAHTQLRCSAILGVQRARSRSQEQELSPPACCRLLYLAVGTWE